MGSLYSRFVSMNLSRRHPTLPIIKMSGILQLCHVFVLLQGRVTLINVPWGVYKLCIIGYRIQTHLNVISSFIMFKSHNIFTSNRLLVDRNSIMAKGRITLKRWCDWICNCWTLTTSQAFCPIPRCYWAPPRGFVSWAFQHALGYLPYEMMTSSSSRKMKQLQIHHDTIWWNSESELDDRQVSAEKTSTTGKQERRASSLTPDAAVDGPTKNQPTACSSVFWLLLT